MKIVQVTYTTIAEYVPQNQANIKIVMSEVRKLNAPGINYKSCLSQDGKTFIHTAFFSTDEDEKALTTLPAFLDFQQQLQASGLEVPPKQDLLTLVGSSKDILSS